jgi:dual specificity MAP kinase phosphatase
MGRLTLCSEHAGNALMLNSIGITHVVSVGESLLGPQNPITAYGGNNLRAAAEQGMIKV